MTEHHSRNLKKIAKVTTSKYETMQAIHDNKKYWNGVFEDIQEKHKIPDNIVDSRLLVDVLPSDLYEKVCDTLQIPKKDSEELEAEPKPEKSPRRTLKEPFITYRTQLHIDREMDSDTDVEHTSSDEEQPNCYWKLLQKPVREQVTWPTRYLGPEREDEKSLITKSDELTDRIAKEFCQYMTELGGNQQSQLFKPEAIKDLFEVEFNTHITRGLQVVPKEIPAVLEKIANAAHSPEKSELAVLERELRKDLKAEQRPDVVRAFGRALPRDKQWRAPRNDTQRVWRASRHVPRDLVTLKTVWEGITNLRSVREYCRWMIDHPEHRRAPYLRSLGMFDPAVLRARTALD